MGNSHRDPWGKWALSGSIERPCLNEHDEEGSRKTLDVSLRLPYMHIHVQAHDPNMKTYACMPHTHIHILKIHKKMYLYMVEHVCYPSTREVEAGESKC